MVDEAQPVRSVQQADRGQPLYAHHLPVDIGQRAAETGEGWHAVQIAPNRAPVAVVEAHGSVSGGPVAEMMPAPRLPTRKWAAGNQAPGRVSVMVVPWPGWLAAVS